MANRLRRLLFGASLIVRVAPHPDSPARLRRATGGLMPARWFAGGTVEAGWLSQRLSSPSAAPAAETVLLLILDSRLDVRQELRSARALGADVRAVYVEADPEQTRRLTAEWARNGAGVPLLILGGDGLPVAASLRAYVELLARERGTGAVSVVLPVCESGTCRAKIRCVLRSIAARLVFGGKPGVRVYRGGLAAARSGRKLAGSPAEA